MPRHDYRCPACGWTLREQYRSVHEGGQANPPRCECGQPMIWIVPRPRMDLRTDGEGKSGQTFQKFMARDGHNNLVEIDSVHKLRQVERESEQLARDGEGQVVRFRAYEQDRSNMSVNVFGERPVDAPTLTKEHKARFGLQHGAQHIDGREAEPEYTYGPGVSDSNTTALEEGS